MFDRILCYAPSSGIAAAAALVNTKSQESAQSKASKQKKNLMAKKSKT